MFDEDDVVEIELTTELADLDRARGALSRGDADGALTDIESYERSFPRGSLHNDPGGPHAKRLRTIAGDDGRALS